MIQGGRLFIWHDDEFDQCEESASSLANPARIVARTTFSDQSLVDCGPLDGPVKDADARSAGKGASKQMRSRSAEEKGDKQQMPPHTA